MDDIVISKGDMHLEDMEGKTWWLGFYKGSKRVTFWISSETEITVSMIENGLDLPMVEQE